MRTENLKFIENLTFSFENFEKKNPYFNTKFKKIIFRICPKKLKFRIPPFKNK